MTGQWGRLVYRHRRLVATLTLLAAASSLLFAARASSDLSPGGWLVRGTEAAAVTDSLATAFGETGSSLIVLFRTLDGALITDAQPQAAVSTSLAALADHPAVAGITRWEESRPVEGLVSNDGTQTYAVVDLNVADEDSTDLTEELGSLIVPPAGLTSQLTGYGPLARDSNEQSEADLQRAELVSLPLSLLILILVFASVVAAGMPLLVAGLAIPTTLGLVFVASQFTEMSIYVLNVSTMLGLALAIDYSLFIVSRFREELAKGRSTADAVERAVATSGKAVVFSGLAVAIGLLGLLFFESTAISSMGIGGSLVVLCSVFYALTFLPAVLGMLGPRVDALSLRSLAGGLGRRLGRTPAVERPVGQSHWARVARWVMAHPVAVLVPTLTVLLLAGLPYLSLQQAVPDAAVLPVGLPSRDAYVALQEDFPGGQGAPYIIVTTVDGDPTEPAQASALASFATAVAALPGVDRVQGPFSLSDPATGTAMSPEQVGDIYASSAEDRPSELNASLAALEAAWIRGSTVRMHALSDLSPVTGPGSDLVTAIRGLDRSGLTSVQVGGIAAISHDTISSMQSRTPWAVGTTLLVIAVVLFLLFGSLVLPVKAVFMTLLSITASFGALVWIFQEGHLAELLGFEPLGYTVAGIPIIMFAVLIGLSMDYEVLLLSRIQEAYRRTKDNRAAVAEGLARTAGVITGAALIMVCVFAAFALAETITIKAIGIGMAIAVAVDATIIRVLLVPATMRLMGRW
ncbi:MAG: MMPL family transporter, partial [Chloroflexi bacterium]|nr:MMPL family transporter [Chloroflexota bacterium]